jgi:hypothetical protein
LTSEKRTQDRFTIRGYLSTALKHGRNMMDTLREAILGRLWTPPDPSPAWPSTATPTHPSTTNPSQ